MRVLLSLLCLVLLASCGSSQKRAQSVFDTQTVPAMVKLYSGPDLPREKEVRVLAEKLDSRYLYFIGIDGKPIKSRSLTQGPIEVRLQPGRHSLQMRFIAKGKLAIPLQPLAAVQMEPGRTYQVESSFEFAPGGYISSARNTRITVRVIEPVNSKTLIRSVYNGMGRKVNP